MRRSVELSTHPAIYLCICIRISEPPLEPPLTLVPVQRFSSNKSPSNGLNNTGVTARVTGRPTGPLLREAPLRTALTQS
jgi:hypothetical protein